MKAFPIHQRELKITEVEVLSSKDREPGEAPGVKLTLVGDFPPTQLDHLVPGISTQLWQKGEQTGVDTDTDLTDRTELAKFLGEITPTDKLTGYTGRVDFGHGKNSTIAIEGAVLHTFKISPKEGGGAKIKFSLDIPNCAEKELGKFGIHKSQLADFTLSPPVIQPDTKPDAAQVGLLNADTPPVGGRPPNPFDKKGAADVSDAEVKPTTDGNPFDTPETALANSLGVQ